jgi:hypothetical protein
MSAPFSHPRVQWAVHFNRSVFNGCRADIEEKPEFLVAFSAIFGTFALTRSSALG